MTDEELMRAALDEAKIAADLGEVPVGAVVAKDGEIVARAHNLRESGKNATYHAELMAIDAACKALGGCKTGEAKVTEGCSLPSSPARCAAELSSTAV